MNFVKQKTLFDIFMDASESGKLYSLQINLRPLFQLNNLGFDISMCFLTQSFESKVKGNFIMVRDSIYIQLRKMLEIVESTASQQKISVLKVLDTIFIVRKGIEGPLMEWIEYIIAGTKLPHRKGQITASDAQQILVKFS